MKNLRRNFSLCGEEKHSQAVPTQTEDLFGFLCVSGPSASSRSPSCMLSKLLWRFISFQLAPEQPHSNKPTTSSSPSPSSSAGMANKKQKTKKTKNKKITQNRREIYIRNVEGCSTDRAHFTLTGAKNNKKNQTPNALTKAKWILCRK